MKVKNFSTTEEITVAELFDKLDSYLIEDIKAMLDTSRTDLRGVGYPSLLTILLGMELLGLLISGDRESSFREIWDRLGSIDSRYKSKKLRHVFRQAIRNGIAHIYLTKSGIYVHYDKPENHLRKVSVGGKDGIFISCSALFDDFSSLYSQIKEDLMKNPQKAHLDKLLENISEGQEHVDKYFKSNDFMEKDDGTILTEVDLSGASGVEGDSDMFFDPRNISV